MEAFSLCHYARELELADAQVYFTMYTRNFMEIYQQSWRMNCVVFAFKCSSHVQEKEEEQNGPKTVGPIHFEINAIYTINTAHRAAMKAAVESMYIRPWRLLKRKRKELCIHRRRIFPAFDTFALKAAYTLLSVDFGCFCFSSSASFTCSS